jgi:predicted dehydrogenase
LLRLGLIAGGSMGERYARALSQLPGAELTALSATPVGRSLAIRATRCHEPASLVALPSVDGVVLASADVAPYPLIRRALVRGKHVLAAGPFVLTSEEVQRLSTLAERAGRLLMFSEERMLSPGFGLLAEMTRGATRSQFHYLRLLDVRPWHRVEVPRTAAIAAEGLALCARLVRRMPRSISALGVGPAGGHPEAAFITLVYPGGLVASLQVSVSEDWEARQLVASMAGRTLMLDELDYRTPLRIVSASERTQREAAGAKAPGGSSWQTGSVTLAAPPGDPTLEQCRNFMDGVIARRRGALNGEFWRQVAVLWEAAERSMPLAGAPVSVEAPPAESGAMTVTPRLHVIRGRGQPVRSTSASARPALTLVSV